MEEECDSTVVIIIFVNSHSAKQRIKHKVLKSSTHNKCACVPDVPSLPAQPLQLPFPHNYKNKRFWNSPKDPLY